jgi:hypothetical protein
LALSRSVIRKPTSSATIAQWKRDTLGSLSTRWFCGAAPIASSRPLGWTRAPRSGPATTSSARSRTRNDTTRPPLEMIVVARRAAPASAEGRVSRSVPTTSHPTGPGADRLPGNRSVPDFAA